MTTNVHLVHLKLFLALLGITLYDMSMLDLVATLKNEIPGTSERGIRCALEEMCKLMDRVSTPLSLNQ